MKNRHVCDSHRLVLGTLSIGNHVLNYVLQKKYGTMGVSPRIKRKCASLLHGLMRTCLGVGLGIGFQALLVMLGTLVSKPLSAFITTRRVAECSRFQCSISTGKKCAGAILWGSHRSEVKNSFGIVELLFPGLC